MESPRDMPTAADYARANANKTRREQEAQHRAIIDLMNRVSALERQVLVLGLRLAGQGDPAEAAEILPPTAPQQPTAQTVWVVGFVGYDSPPMPASVHASLESAMSGHPNYTWEGPDEDGEYITANADACANRGYRIVPMELHG